MSVNPERNQENSSEDRRRYRALVDMEAVLWRWLNSPWLLLACTSLALFMVLFALFLPQVPGELAEQSAAGARWRLATAGDYGALGDLMLSLGLFSVLDSTIFRVLLAAIALCIFVQLATSFGQALTVQRLPGLLYESVDGSLGEPLSIQPYKTLFRRRYTATKQLADTLDDVAALVQRPYSASYVAGGSRVEAIELDGRDTPAPYGTSAYQKAAPPEPEAERRILAVHHRFAYFLRPVLLAGLLLSLGVVWLFVIFGWQISTPSLAPGDSFRIATRPLEVHYPVPAEIEALDGSRPAYLEITLATETISQAVQSPAAGRLGRATVNVSHDTPAVLVSTANGAAALTRPGESVSASAIGLTFPSPGSEETILLPQEAAGVRIVRQKDNPQTFVVEIYQSHDVQPVQRIEIHENSAHRLPVSDTGVFIDITPFPGLTADIRYMPGSTFLWLSLVLVLVGAAGFYLSPDFLLVQLIDWPTGRTALIVQGDRRAAIDELAIHTDARLAVSDLADQQELASSDNPNRQD